MIQGTVAKINEVNFRDDIMLYSFILEEGSTVWRMGRVKPEFEEGTCIEFEEKKGNVLPGTLRAVTVKAGAVEAPSERVSTKTAAPSGTAADVGTRLRYQAARRDATRIVVAALEADHLPHAINIAKAKRLPLLLGYVEEVTLSLLEQESDNV